MNFCTLFDSYYLDKGLALYRSLSKVTEDFTLYVFCFDDKAKAILDGMTLPHLVVLHHSDFETEELLKLKKERSGRSTVGPVHLLLLNMCWIIIRWTAVRIWIPICIFMRIRHCCFRK